MLRTEAYILNPYPECVPAEWARELERELLTLKDQSPSSSQAKIFSFEGYDFGNKRWVQSAYIYSSINECEAAAKSWQKYRITTYSPLITQPSP